MDEIIFKFNKKDIEKQIEGALRSQVKSYATALGLASFDLLKYIETKPELQKIIKDELKKRIKDDKFIRTLIEKIIKEEFKNKMFR